MRKVYTSFFGRSHLTPSRPRGSFRHPISLSLFSFTTRTTWLSWRRPNFGVGSIRDRERNDLKLYTKESTEKRLFTPLQQHHKPDSMDDEAIVFYNNLLRKAIQNKVSIDVVMHTRPKPMAFLDLATLGELCRGTAGRLKWIRAADWRQELKLELW